MAKAQKNATASKAGKASKKTATAQATTAPAPNGGWLAMAKQLPAKVAAQVGTIQTVNGKPANITHVGALAVNANHSKPQTLAVHAIVKLLKAGKVVLAARTMRHLTLKKMAGRANQNGLKPVVIVNP